MSDRNNTGFTLAALQVLFEEECQALGLERISASENGRFVVGRATTRQGARVGTRDMIKGGVALRGDGARIEVRPYTYRLVCRNGAIMGIQMAAGALIEGVATRPRAEVEHGLRAVIRACCSTDVLARSGRAFRAAHAQAPLEGMAEAVQWLRLTPDLLEGVQQRFAMHRDGSMFDLVQAVTSLARDTADVEQRWNLESLGGLLARLATGPKQRGRAGVVVRPEAVHDGLGVPRGTAWDGRL
jgi:hypothetical protein